MREGACQVKSTYGAPLAPLAVLATARTCGGGVVVAWRSPRRHAGSRQVAAAVSHARLGCGRCFVTR